ncbi:hypothetical protein [Chroococcus sp. FPU101]|uniref:hypothetical protein n=1 Tax=Chroococcus sp. FPU101 TaxID=1974212 RepID=UPI001A8DB7AB|nr:hypothetical protein [Chroococcus sp. FPU101]GFE71254.1 hypothetical protein CFPU101_38640 [Chroococcus sp. FPU101]
MITPKNLGLGIVLTVFSLSTLTAKGFAYNFHYTSAETEIVNTDFDSSNGWLLNGTVIDRGTIKASSSWGSASYPIAPVNLDQGDVFLYWSGIFPSSARTEPDKYYVGLQYADNAPVCYNSQTNSIVGSPPCTGIAVSEVDENAELKVEIRPRDRTNITNTYHRLYIDPDFDPVNNYSPVSTRVNVPNYQEAVAMDFRLNIRKVSSSQYEAMLAFWNGISWLSMTPKSGYTLPLNISSSNWIDANRQISNSVTFEAINLLFRQAASTRQSMITAVALTQISPQTRSLALNQARPQAIQVNESSKNLALPLVLGLGMLFIKKPKTDT